MSNKLNPRDVALSLVASRSTLELGEPWEILLQIVNHSDSPIWLTNATTTLTLPAEVIHPSESNVASRGAQCPTFGGSGIDSVCVLPGASYTCTWRLNENSKDLAAKSSTWERMRWHVFFHPAKYDIQANIHVWSEPPNIERILAPRLIKKANLGSETAVNENAESLTEPQGISSVQSMITAKNAQSEELAKSMSLVAKGTIEVGIKALSAFVAAALGGLLAFAFREFYWLHTEPCKVGAEDFFLLPTFVLTAVLLSLVVSRVSEARFPLTIRVMDFWGATAFGVLAAFLGNALITKIVGAMP